VKHVARIVLGDWLAATPEFQKTKSISSISCRILAVVESSGRPTVKTERRNLGSYRDLGPPNLSSSPTFNLAFLDTFAHPVLNLTNPTTTLSYCAQAAVEGFSSSVRT
jgi:hypothetical protein